MNKEQAEKNINELFTRGVSSFIDPNDTFRNKLIAKSKGEYQQDIIVKLGVDPTRPDIHLGHAVILRKLRTLQDLGCKVVFIVGDFTAQIGDPTGKNKARPLVEQEEVEKNMRTYLDQIGKILKIERDQNGNILHTPQFSWMRNSDWFVGVTDIGVAPETKIKLALNTEEGKQLEGNIDANTFIGKAVVYEHSRMQKTALQRAEIEGITLINLLATLRHITFAQLIERDMFQERIKSGESLFMHEMLYPVIQGIDSVVIHRVYGACDIELGGTDQTFNLLMGRKTMEIAGFPAQSALSIDLLVGTDGKEKMSKSLDNYIAVNEEPRAMFGKVMSIPDAAIEQYFILATYSTNEAINDVLSRMAKGENPRDIKLNLAQQIVEIYHGKEKAEEARSEFINIFQNKETPNNILEVVSHKGTVIADALVAEKIIASKSEYRRLVDEGAISVVGGEKIENIFQTAEQDTVLRIGKHRFVRLVIT